MGDSDDQSMDRTRAEAERLLEDLDRIPLSRGSGDGRPDTGVGTISHATSPSGRPAGVPMSWLLLAALAFGTVLTALVLLILFRQPDRSRDSGGTPITSRERPSGEAVPALRSEAPSAPSDPSPSSAPPREVPNKGQNPEFRAPQPVASARPEPKGAWGSASDYKFGRLPDATYPDSCAFSQTDSNGQALVSRSSVDYWACRDEGGNATDGFSVAWADGKRTTYKFGPGGLGAVIGTNGSTYPITWRNDYRNGSKVIIISHEEGSTSWIPGHVN
jgi:hypothetical protein